MTNPTSKFLNKDNLDRFYTKPSVVDNLLNEITLEDYDVVVEPSAGTGSWSSKIDDCVAIDISPEHPDIMKGDFLEDDFLFNKMKEENKILVIGNPPFGRIGNKAVKFINKAAEFADTIAFILPRSFRKESLQRRIHKNFWLIKDVDLFEESCFIFNGEDYFAPCVFQIWEHREEERDVSVKKIEPVGFSYVKRDSANLVIRRVGGAAGTAYTDKIEERNIPANYFLWVGDPQEVADFSPDFPMPIKILPQLGSSPAMAVLTKGELTIFINSLTNPQ